MSSQLNPEQAAKLEEFFAARKAAGAWKKEADKLRVELEEMVPLNTPESFADADGVYVGRVRHVAGVRFNVKRLQSERPEVYAQFQEETNQVRIEEPK